MSRARAGAFSLVELVVVLMVVGILAAVALPRFAGRGAFDTRGFTDQVGAALRFAQKAAIAQRRVVCVALTTNTVSLTVAAAPPPSVACGSPLSIPGASGNTLTAPSGVILTPATLRFDALGQASAALTVTVTGDPPPRTITVEAETGYVH